VIRDSYERGNFAVFNSGAIRLSSLTTLLSVSTFETTALTCIWTSSPPAPILGFDVKCYPNRHEADVECASLIADLCLLYDRNLPSDRDYRLPAVDCHHFRTAFTVARPLRMRAAILLRNFRGAASSSYVKKLRWRMIPLRQEIPDSRYRSKYHPAPRSLLGRGHRDRPH